MKQTIKETLGFLYYNLYQRYSSKIGNRALIYHAFGAKLKHDTYGISIQLNKFKDHIKYLTDNYIFTNGRSLIKNKFTLSITIDDGYKDTIGAVEVLNDYNIPFYLFITADNINKKDYLSDNELFDISKLDIATIGSHGLTHVKLGDISYNNQKTELKKSKDLLEKIIRKPVKTLSYPHGSYNNDTLRVANYLQYEQGYCSTKGLNVANTNKLLLRRSEIIATDTFKDLKKKITGFYDYY